MADPLRLKGAFSPTGDDVEALIEWEDLWELVDSKSLAAEFSERCSEKDQDCIHTACLWAPDLEDEDQPFGELSEWDRAELLRAVKLDDGKRALELLRRQVRP